MKETALSAVHTELGAKMVPFAGYNMPVSYAGLKHEHEVVRTKVGVFDVSHMGEFFVKGEHAEALLQKVTSNDVSKLVPGKAQYCYVPNKTGGIIDDLIIYKIADLEFMLVVNASNIEKDWNWISSQNDVGAELTNNSDEWSLLAIQGPKAAEAMQSLTSVDLAGMKFYTFEISEFAGVKDVIISATGYTGSGGFEIYVKNKDVKQVWDKVFEAGEAFGIEPIGLGARDTLRLEMGFCLYGNDIDETTSPFEAGLGWITKFTKDFTNSEALKAEKEAGIKNKLVGFELKDKGIPRQGYPILNAAGDEIGRVTSGTMSPSLDKAIGMGYVPVDVANVGGEIFIGVRNKSLAAEIVKTPFYKG
ncbi:glycine cleavage system aminomethyltransferase GcvT [Brumimicrobium glaciale]|uniref:Aminomethyltransferase n=1 Tax=Brumimicrobium glaciale TaxID=200475 RepID=A0A4Q4KMZ6_9FLAO|nr:glycine cleavage system aminomethyltransferase GcvT [Brumimicrobium glaciale]RYM33289.1 glycine cleavage system aminomethyltransferase GcvT [Brumimicrobium glaciale]